MSHLCATAMTPRDFGPPTRTPRQHFELLLSGALDVLAVPDEAAPPTDEPAPAPRCNQSGVAFLFGCERFGMSNDDVYRSDVALSIPSNPQFGSPQPAFQPRATDSRGNPHPARCCEGHAAEHSTEPLD
jgi:tRNA/rRNA methyltransferase